MRFFLLTAGIPLAFLAVGGYIMHVTQNTEGPGVTLAAVGFVWLALSAKRRKTYWNTRLRVRAARDERRAS
jgi:hypothetical protein